MSAEALVNRLLEDEEGDPASYLAGLPEREVSLKSATVPGDGITAPLRVVLHKANHNGEWVTHLENMQVGGYMFGRYHGNDYAKAVEDFNYRCAKIGVDPESAESFMESVMQEAKSPKMKALKDNRVELEPSERKEVMRRKAVWHHGAGGKESPAVWKSVVRGKTYYVCNTHRAAAVKPTLKGAIRAFDFIKTTS